MGNRERLLSNLMLVFLLFVLHLLRASHRLSECPLKYILRKVTLDLVLAEHKASSLWLLEVSSRPSLPHTNRVYQLGLSCLFFYK